MTTRYSNDTDLAISLRNSDEPAFREVFDRYHRRVYQFVYGFLNDHVQSEDIVQETFLKFWMYRENLSLDMSIAPLLFAMTRRAIINHWKKCASSAKLRQQLLATFDDVDTNTEDYIATQEIARISEEALGLLTNQQKEIFLLSRDKGLTYAEIAEQLHISRHTVKYHLTNALNTFRQHFAKNDILYTSFLVFYLSDLQSFTKNILF